MNEKEILKELYIKLCDASITKNLDILEEILSDDYILVHMTGRKQTKQEYIDSVKNGELKYFKSIHENIEIKINGNEAILIGKTKILASPFGFSKSWWNLKQEILFIKENEKWIIKKSKAESY